jgi:C4-dicarboxylate transporter DctM subunit
MNTFVLFTCLFLFMAIGMPVAISLGLSSLLTIAFFSQDSLASMSIKLFETSEHYTLMAIPFFVLAGNLMSTGGVAKRMVRVCHRCGGPPARRLGHCVHPGLHVVCGGVGLQPGHRGGHWLHRDRRHGQERLHQGVRRWRDLQRWHAGHPDSAFHRDGGLCRRDRSVGGSPVHGGRHSRSAAGLDADGSGLVACRQAADHAAAQGQRARSADSAADSMWGLALLVIIMGGIYGGVFTPTEAAAVSAVYAWWWPCLSTKTLGSRTCPRCSWSRPKPP